MMVHTGNVNNIKIEHLSANVKRINHINHIRLTFEIRKTYNEHCKSNKLYENVKLINQCKVNMWYSYFGCTKRVPAQKAEATAGMETPAAPPLPKACLTLSSGPLQLFRVGVVGRRFFSKFVFIGRFRLLLVIIGFS